MYVNGKDVSSTSSIAAGAASPVLPVPGGGIGTIVGLGQLDLHHRSGTPNSGWKSSSSTTGSPVPSNDGNNQPDASGWVFQLKTDIFANFKHSLYLRLTESLVCSLENRHFKQEKLELHITIFSFSVFWPVYWVLRFFALDCFKCPIGKPALQSESSL